MKTAWFCFFLTVGILATAGTGLLLIRSAGLLDFTYYRFSFPLWFEFEEYLCIRKEKELTLSGKARGGTGGAGWFNFFR